MNKDVSFLPFAGKLWATSDIDVFVGVDPDTLNVTTPHGWGFNDAIGRSRGVMGVTHVGVDYDTDEVFSFACEGVPTAFGKNATTSFWRAKGSDVRTAPNGSVTWQRDVIATISTQNATYAHSLGLSKRDVVWFENPIKFDDLLIPFGVPPMKALTGLPNVRTRIHLIDRVTGATRSVLAP